MKEVWSPLLLSVWWLLGALQELWRAVGSQGRSGLGTAGLHRASGVGELELQLRILFPLSELCLLDCTSVSCSAMLLLLAEAERGKAGSGNLTCVWAVRMADV